MHILSVREHPEWTDRSIAYFQSKWASDETMPVYEDSISHAVTASAPLPQWYLLVQEEKIIGCAGLITNDFISRMDLYPWLCALYVEPEHRGLGLAGKLIAQVKQDALRAGFTHLYLCTDLTGYYERYDFSHIGTGYHPWGEASSIFEAKL